MSITDELIPLLKKLRLSGVLQSLELRLKQAREDSLPYEEFLFRLLRRGRTPGREAARAACAARQLEHAKTLEDFDFHFQPERAELEGHRPRDVRLRGPATERVAARTDGVGKSHIAQALGHRACRLGKTVLYVAAQDLFKQLRAARADGTHDRKLLRFTSPDLLIVDDLGLRALRDDEPVALYEIIRARYERHATVITSNRTAEEMGALFGDPLLASAAMDRLLHDAHVLILDGASFRNPPAERRKSKKNSHQETSAP
jgi:DNA replication protein DnaC